MPKKENQTGTSNCLHHCTVSINSHYGFSTPVALEHTPSVWDWIVKLNGFSSCLFQIFFFRKCDSDSDVCMDSVCWYCKKQTQAAMLTVRKV